MMKVTELLNVEHGVFLTQLAHLEKLVQDRAPKNVLAALVQSIAAAVETHKEIEERHLYPAILQIKGKNFPPMMVMEQEHQAIERTVKDIAGGPFNAGSVQFFVDTLRQHIAKEINVLFPLAEQQISDDELEEMARKGIEETHARLGVKILQIEQKMERK